MTTRANTTTHLQILFWSLQGLNTAFSRHLPARVISLCALTMSMASEVLNSLIVYNHTRNMWPESQQQNYSSVQSGDSDAPSTGDLNPSSREIIITRPQRSLSICLLSLALILFWAAGFALGRLSFSDPDCLRRLSRSCTYSQRTGIT